ncbi:AraC-like DNA-binding protein [Marmoricola sp. URHA0025 HA25]
MVKTGQERSAIRRVHFTPPGPAVADIEVNALAGIRERGGPREFLTSQRLDFDLLLRVEAGTAMHTVDFAELRLEPGDVLWVHAGQVHRWGAIDDIEGPVVMFGPHTVDGPVRELVGSHAVRLRSHWRAADLAGSPVALALDLLIASAGGGPDEPRTLRQAALTHALTTLVAHLTLVGSAGPAPVARPTHEAYAWFRDHVEEHFRSWHQVGEYADRLGYSARTLNRLARHNTGLTAKELIDERIALEAKRLLSHEDAPVSEVGRQLGFDDASNFSSWFRKQARMTPAAFRTWSRGDTARSAAR